MNSAGTLFVTDTDDHVLRQITAGGVVTTLAGTAGMSGSTDATGAAARFNRPKSVAVDTAGNLLVVDAENNCIRRVTPAGIVTTVLGSANAVGVRLGTLPTTLGNVSAIAIPSSGNPVIVAENSVLDVLLQ